MGRSPYPLCAASAAGSALGLAEDGKAQSHQTGADEQRQNGIGDHDVPDITDQRSQRTGVTKNGSNGGRSSFLKSTLLSKKMYGCGERGRTSITEFRARPVTVTAPRHVTRCGVGQLGHPRRSVSLLCYSLVSNSLKHCSRPLSRFSREIMNVCASR